MFIAPCEGPDGHVTAMLKLPRQTVNEMWAFYSVRSERQLIDPNSGGFCKNSGSSQ